MCNMSQVCFGVETCPDGSVVVASRDCGDITVTRVEAGAAQLAKVVALVHDHARSPRVCVADRGSHGLNLALEIGGLDDAEVFLVQPESLGHGEPLALALARYARRAA
jgi:hypothetical protein